MHTNEPDWSVTYFFGFALALLQLLLVDLHYS